MDIENQTSQAGGKFSRLEELYATVPKWRNILAAVKAGETEFMDVLAKMGLLKEFGAYTSAVHAYAEIEIHAFILGIVSDDRWDEIQAKSFLTYASHWIDDFFDSPDRVGNPSQLLADRRDIRRALANMGPAGQVGFAMASRVPHPDAVYKSLHRMLYGGMVQRSLDYAERRTLVGEYQTIATRFVDSGLARQILQLQPQAYWTTNKTVQELLNAAEHDLDFNTAELWNLVYAPAIYYQDLDEERERGESNFAEEEAPRMSEMLRMIRLGARYLAQTGKKGSLQIAQLRFAALALPNLPDQVAGEYRLLCEDGIADIAAD